MADFEVRFNTTEILGAATQAFQETNELLGVEFQKRITDLVWPWPGKTVRKTGVVADSPRNIVDQGQLRDSYNNGRRITPTVFEHAWDTEYAMAVHEGAVFKRGGTLPGRPWVRVTLREVDVADIYARLARALLSQVKDPP